MSVLSEQTLSDNNEDIDPLSRLTAVLCAYGCNREVWR